MLREARKMKKYCPNKYEEFKNIIRESSKD